MTKFGKVLAVIAAVLALVMAGVWFFVLRDAGGEEWDPNAGVSGVVPPSGNSVTQTGTIDRDPGNVGDNSNIIQLPPYEEDNTGSENTQPPDNLVDADGIPTAEGIAYAQLSDPNLYGRLVIPLAGINVRLYQSTSSSTTSAEDSAALFQLGSAIVIADYWTQGFSGLQNCSKGTEMYIVTNAGSTHYKCSRSEKGSMVQSNLEYQDGSHVTDAPVGAISCYAQMNAEGDVWIVEFTDNGETTSIGAGSQNGQGVDPPTAQTPGTSTTQPSASSQQPSQGNNPSSGQSTQQPGQSGSSSLSNSGSSSEDWTSGAGYEYSIVD